jgi:WD40 repeat protein
MMIGSFRRRAMMMFACLWVAGIGALWWLTPVMPRDGWQPPADEFACGFLGDSRTLVTIRSANGTRAYGTPETGPIHVWDIESGKLLASHFNTQDVSNRVLISEAGDLLKLKQHAKGAAPYDFRLRLLEPRTGLEVASFRCRALQDCWILTRDGRTTAFVTYDMDGPLVEWYDVASGRLLRRLPGCRESIRFSPDGRRFAAYRGHSIVVFDVPGGKEIGRFSLPGRPVHQTWLQAFSPDGTMLLEGGCNVWDVAAGKLRFAAPGAGGVFTPDGRHIATVDQAPSGSWLAYYDISTGQESPELRVRLVGGTDPTMYLAPATNDGRLVIALANPRTGPPTRIEAWLSRVPFLNNWLPGTTARDAYVLIETATGREITRGNGSTRAWSCTDDGRYLVGTSHDVVYELWDVPARKSLRVFLAVGVGWSLIVGVLAYWRRWRRGVGA